MIDAGALHLFIIMIIRLSVQGRQVGGLFSARLQQDGDEWYRFFVGVCWELLWDIDVLANSGVEYCKYQSINMLCPVEIKT